MRKLTRHKKISLSATLIGGVLLFFFQNCQSNLNHYEVVNSVTRAPSSVATQVEPATLSKDPVVLARKIFENGKLQIDRSSSHGLQGKSSPSAVLEGESLIAVVHNDCLRDGGGALSSMIYSPDSELQGLSVQSYRWTLEHDMSLAQLAELAEADPCVLGLSHDGVARASRLPNDPLFGQQAQNVAIGVGDTWDFFNDPLRGARTKVVVGIVDSGVNYNHSDLRANLWTDGGGSFGYNLRSNTTLVLDDYGHGTAVTGLLAAVGDNGQGVAGVINHDVQAMALKVQDSEGHALVSDITRAVDYARSMHVDVVNISMEADTANAALQTALTQAVSAGIFIAVAAGNSNLEIGDTNFVIPAYYARDLAGVMAVGSIDSYSGARSSFSNFGTAFVEIAAPGSNGLLFTDKSGQYTTGQGTSYACPLVAGAAALIVSFFKKNGITYTAADIEAILKASAQKNRKLNTYFLDGNTLDLRSLAYYLQRKYLSPLDGGYDEN